MTLGLLSGLFGGGNATQAQATQPVMANNNLDMNSLVNAFNSIYQSGMTAGMAQGGMGMMGNAGGNAAANSNANLNIGLYGGGNMVPSMISHIHGDNGSSGFQSHSHPGSQTHSHTSNLGPQGGYSNYGAALQGMNGFPGYSSSVQQGYGAGAPQGMNMGYQTYGAGMPQGGMQIGGQMGRMPAVLPGLSAEQTNSLLSNLGAGNQGVQGTQGAQGSQGNGGLLGGLLGGGQGGGGLLGPLGGIVGGLLQGVHGMAEGVINMTGMGSLFAPIDDAIIHPLLWDPLSMLTGTDVSKHPDGIADVSDPIGRGGASSASSQSSGGGLLGGLLGGGQGGGLLGNLLNII